MQFAMCFIEFIRLDKFSVPPTMPFVYFLLVMFYVLKKNVDRWLESNRKRRRGELYLVGWWVALLVMYVTEFASHGSYHVPHKMIETCILILLPYGTNIISKIMRRRSLAACHKKRHVMAHGIERMHARSS